MLIVGLNLGFNSSAAVYDTDKQQFIGMLQTESITGNKNTKELPAICVFHILKHLTSSKDNPIELHVAYSLYEPLTCEYLRKHSSMYNLSDEDISFDSADPESLLANIVSKVCENYGLYVFIKDTRYIEHNAAHAYSAYAVYGKPKSYHAMLIVDGLGGATSVRLGTMDENNKYTCLVHLPLVSSPALVYQFVTEALDLKPHQHEGIVTSIATMVHHSDKAQRRAVTYYEAFTCNLYGNAARAFRCHEVVPSVSACLLPYLNNDEHAQAEHSSLSCFDKFLRLRKLVIDFCKDRLPSDYTPSDILSYDAAVALCIMAQKYVEDFVYTLLTTQGIATDKPIFCAGELFANVAINRLVGNLCSAVYVSPCTGDEGTALGAAWVYAECYGYELPEYMDSYAVLHNSGIAPSATYTLYDKLIHFQAQRPLVSIKHLSEHWQLSDCLFYIAGMLASGEVVHLICEPSEFGPRALMARSTVFAPTQDNIDRVTKALQRSEYMPLTPVMLLEDAHKVFFNYERYIQSARFMTVALPVRSWVKQSDDYKLACHDDGTMCVQLLQHNDNLIAEHILLGYKRATNKLMLINTSFSMHDNPIACTVEQTLDTWEASGFLGKLVIVNDLANVFMLEYKV